MLGRVFVDETIVERELEVVDEVQCRKGTFDGMIVKEVIRCYPFLDFKGQVVLDIGANIGAFARYALKKEAKSVYCYEPEECNFEMLQLNTSAFSQVSCYKKAIYSSAGKLKLYVTKTGKNPGNYSCETSGGRVPVEIDAVLFSEALACNPSIVKVDCEGSEYAFLDGKTLPAYVKQVAVEIHLTKKIWREQEGPALIASFAGWTCLKVPKVGLKNWTTTAVWKRN